MKSRFFVQPCTYGFRFSHQLDDTDTQQLLLWQLAAASNILGEYQIGAIESTYMTWHDEGWQDDDEVGIH